MPGASASFAGGNASEESCSDRVLWRISGKSLELDWIKKEVQRYVTFEQVIVQKVSFSVACNLGLGTIGIACFTK